MSETEQKPKRLCIVTPGAEFSAQWLCEYDQMFMHIAHRFLFSRVYGMSNNIYLVRQNAVSQVLQDPQGVADYVLWIDSDNPPSVKAFAALMAQMEASEQRPEMPPIDIIGAWYRYCNPADEKTWVAAGYTQGLRKGQLSEMDIRKAARENSLIEDLGYIGFGLLLMRGSVVEKLGPQGFWPKPVDDGRGFLTDDVSWCARATEAGYRIFLHPGAFVEHLKSTFIPSAIVDSSKVHLISDSEKFIEEKAS